jgi:hypothetical protein
MKEHMNVLQLYAVLTEHAIRASLGSLGRDSSDIVSDKSREELLLTATKQLRILIESLELETHPSDELLHLWINSELYQIVAINTSGGPEMNDPTCL